MQPIQEQRMKNSLKSILCLTVLLFTIAFPSCTKETADNSESGSTPPPETERKMLTNVFTEEPLELPDGFSISSSAAIEHNGEETRVHLTKYIPDGDISRNEHYIYRIPEEGEPVLEKLELDSDVLDGTSLFCGDDLIVFESSFDDSTFISSYNLVKCSLTDGKTTRVDNVTDIFPTPVEQLTSFVADADGYIYMTDGNSLCVMAPDLTKAFDYVFRDSVSSLAVSADGKVFAVGTDAVYTIDRDLCAPGNPLEIPEELSIENCYFGPGYDIYYENNEGLYGYNFGSESGECVISWQNSNMEGSMFDNIHVLSPEKVFATRFDFKNNEIAAVILEKTDDIDLSDYVTIEVAYAYEPPYYSQTVLDYNSDRTKKIRVITKDYSVYNTETKKDGAKKQLLLDMTTGKYMPDIVVDMPDYIKVTDKTAIITLLKQGYYRYLY